MALNALDVVLMAAASELDPKKLEALAERVAYFGAMSHRIEDRDEVARATNALISFAEYLELPEDVSAVG